MISRHPDEDLVLSLATGRLPAGPAAVVGAHVEQCAACRAMLVMLDAVGGTLLENAEVSAMTALSLANVLRRTGQAPRAARAAPVAPASAMALPPLPNGARWPASLRGSRLAPWRWIGVGSRVARVRLPHDPQARVYLFCIAAGRGLPPHGHGMRELTQVLAGAFDDGREVFQPGDFGVAGDQVRHRPVARADGACVCLASIEGELDFEGPVTSALARWACA